MPERGASFSGHGWVNRASLRGFETEFQWGFPCLFPFLNSPCTLNRSSEKLSVETGTDTFHLSISGLYESMMQEIAAEHSGDLKNRWTEMGVERIESIRLAMDSGMTEQEELLEWKQCTQNIAAVVRKLQWRWDRKSASVSA